MTPAGLGQASYAWVGTTGETRALQKANNPADRIEAAWYAANQFTIDMNICDAGTHEVALYCFDWNDTGTRRQTIEVLNGSGQVLDTQALTTNFYGGVYLVWRVNGHVQIRVTNNAGPTMNAVVSGIFLATPPAAQTVNVMGGSPQTTTVGTAFGAGLQAQVLDGSSHPMSGVTVTFAAPGSGASALFGGLATATVGRTQAESRRVLLRWRTRWRERIR